LIGVAHRIAACALVPFLITHFSVAESLQNSKIVEVASIKVDKSGGPGVKVAISGRRLMVSNVPAKTLITVAYEIQDFQIEGGPGWLTSDKYQIDAEAEETPNEDLQKGEGERLHRMLLELLADLSS
jgi:uncharacterized protein (TIGR03435 family)